MSLAIDRIPPVSAHTLPGTQSKLRPCEYTQLVERLFQGPSVVAIIGAGSGTGVTAVCQELVTELSRLGRSVVLVSVAALLRPNTIAVPDENSFVPGPARNVYLWPPPAAQQSEFFNPRTPGAPEKWLDSLRLNFDSVLLDCPSVEAAPGSAAIAAMAGATVLAVDAAGTSKRQILLDQRVLQLSGVKLAGCIFINAK